MLVTFSPAHSQSRSKNGTERSETIFAHTCVLQPDCPAPGDTCHEHMPEHPHLTPSLLATQHRTFGFNLSPRSCQNTPRQRFHFLPPVSSTSQPSPAVLVQTDSTALGKAGSEPVCAVERQRAGQSIFQGVGQDAGLAPGLHCLHLGSHSVGISLSKAGRYWRGKGDADVYEKALLVLN